MTRDPFAPLTRSARWRARGLRLRRALLRPLRPTRRPGPAERTNLLLIGVDTLRADHVGCLGCPLPTTPRLDALAVGGTVFADVTAPAPWTLPSFAAALTGLMPGLHGAYLGAAVRNMDRQPPRRLDDDAITLAAHLRAHGYRTAAFYSNPFFGFGLAETFDHHAYLNLAAGDLADAAGDWIRRHADRPFFCFVLMNDPHEPTTPRPADLAGFVPPGADPGHLVRLARWGEPPLPHLGRAPVPGDATLAEALALKKAVYAAAVHEVDRAVGGLQEQLAARDLAGRTVVSVFSDHGEEFREHAAQAARWSHDPRGLLGIGHGHTQFQELLHVPWVAWGPGVPAGVRREEPVSLCDLAPTAARWLGVPLDPSSTAAGRRAAAAEVPLTGVDLADGPAAADRLLLAEAVAYGPDLVALRRGADKLLAHRDGRPLALHDLAADPDERRDLQEEEPARLRALGEELARWNRTGLGATDGGDGGGWSDLDGTVRQRLRDLGYAE